MEKKKDGDIVGMFVRTHLPPMFAACRWRKAGPLRQELTALATQPQYVYVHHWRPKDLVMEENRCCLHRRRPWDKA